MVSHSNRTKSIDDRANLVMHMTILMLDHRAIIGDYLGKDTIVNVDPCDHAQKLIEEFSRCVDSVKHGGKANLEWPKRSLVTHTIMCAIYESAMRGVLAPLLN